MSRRYHHIKHAIVEREIMSIELMEEPNGYTIKLGEEANDEQLEILCQHGEQIMKAPKNIHVDTSSATSISYSCVQYLISLNRTAQAQGHRFSFGRNTDGIMEILAKFDILKHLQ
jgi:ABC-type transporter Mla MlaB component